MLNLHRMNLKIHVKTKSMKLPPFPKGLKARLNKARKKAEKIKAVKDRKAEIAKARAELKKLTASNSKGK
jgi:hypothetical protein